jgi:hypothetical protein
MDEVIYADPKDELRRKRLVALRLVCIRFGGKYMDSSDTPIVVQDFCLLTKVFHFY